MPHSTPDPKIPTWAKVVIGITVVLIIIIIGFIIGEVKKLR